MESGLVRNEVLYLLSLSPHGKLESYLPVGLRANREDPEFFAHLAAWNAAKGSIRDARVALPVIALQAAHPAFQSNALALLYALSPRELLQAIRFSRAAGPGRQKLLRRLVAQYLRAREAQPAWWDAAVMQHRQSVKELYALCHIKPSAYADQILFKGIYPPNSCFAVVKGLREMDGRAAAVAIYEHDIPLLVAIAAMSKEQAQSADFVMALIDSMSPAELINNASTLERLGVKSSPALRAAYESALKRATQAAVNKASPLKLEKAAAAVSNAETRRQLHAASEKAISKLSIDGDWLVACDKSSSMEESIQLGTFIAGTLTACCKGRVWLLFFDSGARAIEVSGKSLEEIRALCQHVPARGYTSCGAPFAWAAASLQSLDGIAFISDGGHNTNPAPAASYKALCAKFGKQIPVYFYRVKGDFNILSMQLQSVDCPLEYFNLSAGVDYYSLPNLIQTMRPNRYSLVDEIFAFPLKEMKWDSLPQQSVA